MTEALAELWHHRIRTALALAADDGPLPKVLHDQGYRGGRYSFRQFGLSCAIAACRPETSNVASYDLP